MTALAKRCRPARSAVSGNTSCSCWEAGAGPTLVARAVGPDASAAGAQNANTAVTNPEIAQKRIRRIVAHVTPALARRAACPRAAVSRWAARRRILKLFMSAALTISPPLAYGTTSARSSRRSSSRRWTSALSSAARFSSALTLRLIDSSSLSSSSTRSTPARFIPSSAVISWIRRSFSTSLWEYSRVPFGERCGSIKPRASYMRSVCGCISASSAATEIMNTPRSEETWTWAVVRVRRTAITPPSRPCWLRPRPGTAWRAGRR